MNRTLHVLICESKVSPAPWAPSTRSTPNRRAWKPVVLLETSVSVLKRSIVAVSRSVGPLFVSTVPEICADTGEVKNTKTAIAAM